MGATLNVPLYVAYLAKAHAELAQMDDTSRCHWRSDDGYSLYGWFTEGFETRDLKEAKALLDELHA